MAKEKRIVYTDSRGEVFTAAEEKGIWREEESKGRPEKELDYYDCPFSTDIELEDFSKEFLVKLMRIWTNWYIGMALMWWAKVGEKFGQEAANELLPEVWENLAKQGMPAYLPLLGGDYKSVDDLKTVKECLHLGHLPPDGGIDKLLWRGTVRWETDNHCVATVTHCVLLEYFESIGATDTIKWLCQVAEVRGAEAYFVHPNIKVTGLKVPPRKKSADPNEPCCIWEYRMMDTPQPRGEGRREVGPNR